VICATAIEAARWATGVVAAAAATAAGVFAKALATAVPPPKPMKAREIKQN
jgi:hypothetical protein